MSSSHSWEQAPAVDPSSSSHVWERPGFDESRVDAEEVPEDPQAAAGECFTEMLTDMYVAGDLTAKAFCVLCHWASLGGIKGPASEFSLPPQSSTGHFQRKLDRVLGLKDKEAKMYDLKLPGYAKWAFSRSSRWTPVIPIHEALHEEVEGDPWLQVPLDPEAAQQEWGGSYANHVVAKGSSRPAQPVAVYLDGVATTNSESVLGFYAYNLRSGRRHLCAVAKRSEMCKCG
eukprot:4618663-Alexandrium_andersonii.AAC.1